MRCVRARACWPEANELLLSSTVRVGGLTISDIDLCRRATSTYVNNGTTEPSRFIRSANWRGSIDFRPGVRRN